ncbi:MAG TPA: tetratricopeptide repeat protein [Methylovirgula sp.]|nr:tetratricopeptide repeat protein [Methylovirgula sp.]
MRLPAWPILVLAALLPAIWAIDRAAAGDDAVQDNPQDSPMPPDGGPSPDGGGTILRLPGMPPIQLPAGVHIFGPGGAQLQDPMDHMQGGPADPGPPKRPAVQSETPEQRAKEAKAEALKRAMAPHPTHAALRGQALDQLFKRLSAANDADEASGIASAIERVWMETDSDTASLLMSRAMAAQQAGHLPLALELYDKVILLEPNWAEAWDKRATTRFLGNDLVGAMADLQQTLKLEPRHFSALVAMGFIFEKQGYDRHALEAFRKALMLNPQQPEIKAIVDKLQVEVEGRDI